MEPKKSQMPYGSYVAGLAHDKAQTKLFASALNAGPNDPRGNSVISKAQENSREYDTQQNVYENMDIRELDAIHKNNPDIYFEVSGDALARAKAGQPAKYHTSI